MAVFEVAVQLEELVSKEEPADLFETVVPFDLVTALGVAPHVWAALNLVQCRAVAV